MAAAQDVHVFHASGLRVQMPTRPASPENAGCEIELFPRHCEEHLRRSNPFGRVRRSGLLRCARNDAFIHLVSLAASYKSNFQDEGIEQVMTQYHR